MAESGLRVLIVDDDPAIAALIRQLIRGQGMPEPLLVETGREALAAPEAVDVNGHRGGRAETEGHFQARAGEHMAVHDGVVHRVGVGIVAEVITGCIQRVRDGGVGAHRGDEENEKEAHGRIQN